MKSSKIIFVMCAAIPGVLNCMEQEPPRKSPKMTLSFLLNPSPIFAQIIKHQQKLRTQPDSATVKKIFFVDESFKHRCPLCSFWESRRCNLKRHLKEEHHMAPEEHSALLKK